jgi:dihydrosphingosine 1-phosphate phosphatase
MGDTISGVVARQVEIACARLIFCSHSQSRDAYLLHDSIANPVLVRSHEFRERVSVYQHHPVHSLMEKYSMVHILASGVFFSGFIKDFWCLPRPLSPPLQRITMSDSAALEYGFPSTHSTNAISVAVYALYLLNTDSPLSPNVNMLLQTIFYFYAFSIVLGRLYCGMHGFFDVIIGSLLGAVISFAQCVYGDAFDFYVHTALPKDIFIIVLFILVLVRIHPEPADDCPCFDDSVAFAGVVIGVEYGSWHFSNSEYAWSHPTPGTVPFDFESMGWTVTVGRIILGVMTIFLWRGSMKPFMFRVLPPFFRVIERLGLSLPRKFFKQASEYTRIPKLRRDDNVIPAISELPSFLTSMRHPRKRAVSIGPQSEADAYETLAYRQKRRSGSISATAGSPSALSEFASYDGANGHTKPKYVANGPISPPARKMSRLETYESMMGTGFDWERQEEAVESPTAELAGENADLQDQQQDEKEMFSRLLKPRVRYDVEVVTKLIVYSGEP